VDANLRARVKTASVGLPLLIAFVGWASERLFGAAIFLLMIAALREYFAMAFPGRGATQVVGIACGVAVSMVVFLDSAGAAGSWLGVILSGLFSASLFFQIQRSERTGRLLLTLAGVLYGGFLLPQWVTLFHQPHGRAWVFWVLLVIMMGDTAAYFVGKRVGRRKLAPKISPGKTVEGAWGYLAGTLLAGTVGAWVLFDDVSPLESFFLSLALGVVGQVGDLFESRLKRLFEVKDSGTVLPGHGGVLDRLDSLIFPAVLTTAYLRAFHP